VNGLALIALLSLGVVWPPLFAQISDPRDAQAGSLFLVSDADAAPVEALRQSTQIRARVTGNVARVHVTQTFENPGDQWVEGLYVFPLSASAAVDELEMLVGERRIRGEIRRKEEARATYEQAKSEGRRASLVTQERPNMFTTSVANIAPRASITIDIAYLDTIPFRDGRYTLNLPLSITPRYTPGATEESTPVATPERVTSAVQTAQIEVELVAGFPLASVTSVNHDVAINVTRNARLISLKRPTAPADRDFELVWKPAVTPDTQASAFAERSGDDTYVLITLMPPQMYAARVYRREVIFIIDTSGSMSGPSIEQAREALQLGVQRLAPGDWFNIIRFSNDASSLFPVSQPAVGGNRTSASGFIGRLTANGGTEMRSALEMAFAMPPAEEALRQIVFITDGSVSNEAELVSLIRKNSGAARLFTVGIGAAPNAWFMREAAAAGRGSYLFVPQIEQVRERMQDLFRKLENPALVDLELHWPDGASPTLAAALPGDVYAGDPLVVAARLGSVPKGMLTLTGRSGGAAWVRQLPITLVGEQAGIAKLWARERIGDLARKKNLGADASEVESQVVDIALAHHLVSDYTSLVAVDVTPIRAAGLENSSQQVPTSAPRGSYWAPSTGFAPTATPAPMLAVAGISALALALGLLLSGGGGRKPALPEERLADKPARALPLRLQR